MNQKKSVPDIMNKFVVLSIMILSFSALFPMAFASKRCETYGPVTVHTGPWDLYDEICTLPSGVEIQAVEYEMNDQDGKLWHMIEFILGDKLYRGYVDEDAPWPLRAPRDTPRQIVPGKRSVVLPGMRMSMPRHPSRRQL